MILRKNVEKKDSVKILNNQSLNKMSQEVVGREFCAQADKTESQENLTVVFRQLADLSVSATDKLKIIETAIKNFSDDRQLLDMYSFYLTMVILELPNSLENSPDREVLRNKMSFLMDKNLKEESRVLAAAAI